ncbi:TIGR04197 family type VII secretion effector, partial [Bacillus toyonensis]
IEKLSQKVQRYEKLLENDISRVQEIGAKMVEKDAKLGQELKVGMQQH